MSKENTPITTSEIANRCGVSRTTVSAVLAGKKSVRESTRKKVLACIREGNFESGMIARALVGELSHTVAVLAPSLGSPYQMMFFRGVCDVLGTQGYHILFHSVLPENREDPATLASIHAYRPAGYIILKGAEGPRAEHARRVAEMGVALVSEEQFEGIETHSINFHNRIAMKLATDYAIEKGHRILGHIAGAPFSQGARERKMGFIEGLIEHDIPVSSAVIADAGESASDGYRVALEVLKTSVPRPTVLLCFNDMVAMGVYRAAHELSLDIPGDLSVIGFDGTYLTEVFGPPLTSVGVFPTEMGRQAAEILLRVIRNQTGRKTVTQWIEPQLVERASVRQL